MNQFEYMMVFVSIIVGLGIAHILLGVGGMTPTQQEPLHFAPAPAF
jgi:hypothetical protein